mgnify:FL=1|tara:strand:+ start:2539 stop:4422 length:1884 start_codon:yes stop_codon:yes gene_type:complete
MKSPLPDLSLRSRILFGFMPVVSLVFVLSILMAMSYATIDDDFADLEKNTRDALRATDFKIHWDDLQRSILLYGLVGYRGVLKKIRQDQKILGNLLDDPAWNPADPDSAEGIRLSRLRAYYAAVAKDFEEIVSTSDRIHRLRRDYEERSIPDLRAWIANVREDAATAGNSTVLRAANRALAVLERIEVNSKLYLEAPDTGTARLALDNSENLKRQLGQLAATAGTGIDIDNADVESAAAEMKQLFSEIVTLKRNQTYLMNVVMAGRNAEIRRASTELSELYLKALEERREGIQKTITVSRSQLWIVFIAVFMLAVVSSILISGSLAKPVNAIAATLSGLARGEFDRDIPGRARRDEVGAIAAAAQAFKVMAQKLDRQSTRLTETNTELERFAYVASHDLQEPLRKIQAFIDILTRALDSGDEAKARDMMTRIIGASARMRELVEDLLAYSRAKRSDSPFSVVSLNEVVAEVIEDLDVVIRETGTRVSIDELPSLAGDPVQLKQMFQNLISNAIKYRQPDREPEIAITLETSDCDCHDAENQHAGHIVVKISDNGIGFDEALFERIVEPFQRLHGRSEYPGSGIGLAIVDNIVKRHGGRLSATSEPGRGSTFRVELPGPEIEDQRHAA